MLKAIALQPFLVAEFPFTLLKKSGNEAWRTVSKMSLTSGTTVWVIHIVLDLLKSVEALD
jgi:hypothetical protein